MRYNGEKSVEEAINELYEKADKLIYHIGDEITVAGEKYYVILDSGATQDYVVAMKYIPLKATEITIYGGKVGYTYDDTNQTGGMVFGSNSTYTTSPVKRVVDAWADTNFTNELKIVDEYEARLITYEELVNELGCISNNCNNSLYSWTYNNDYTYWTMSPQNGNTLRIWRVEDNGSFGNPVVHYNCASVRPVINVYKSAIQK